MNNDSIPKEQILALCHILIKEIDSRPFAFPNIRDKNAQERNAIVNYAIQIIQYGL
jgi:hypothetical protein